ncbi:MAG: shikimate kinase [Quinella sp. 1Q5]|nr:shikimate kinase [Quinella sp. 1Q5]
MRDNVILTGFMGTGKTSLGKLLATRLGRPFVDIDKKIEDEAQMSIPKIFELYGEEHFRELERLAVKELSSRRGMVIATGGGTIKDADNLRLLKSSGVLICLTTEPEEIFNRTERRGERPVLDGGGNERLESIKRLLAERKKFYDQADYQVDTTEWSPLQIIDDICRYLRQFRS